MNYSQYEYAVNDVVTKLFDRYVDIIADRVIEKLNVELEKRIQEEKKAKNEKPKNA